MNPIFRDSVNETTVNSKFGNFDEKLISWFNFNQQTSQPTRVTGTSSTCQNHFITTFQVQTETIPKNLVIISLF